MWGGVVLALHIGGIPGGAYALPSGSMPVYESASVREAQITQIVNLLYGHAKTQAHFRLMGFTPEQLKEQLLRLDDAQLARVAETAQSVKAAGQLEVLIVLLVVAIVVVIVLKLADKEIEVKDKEKSDASKK